MGDSSDRTTPRDDRFYTPRAVTGSISSENYDSGTPRSARDFATPRSARYADSKSDTGSDYYATPRSARVFDDPESSTSGRFGIMRRNSNPSGTKDANPHSAAGYPPTSRGSSAQSSPRYYPAAADLPRPYEDRSASSSAAPSPRQRPGLPARRSSGSFSNSTQLRTQSISEYDDMSYYDGEQAPNSPLSGRAHGRFADDDAHADAKLTGLEHDAEVLGVEDQVSAEDVEDIFRFARHGRCEEMERLLDMGIPINVRDEFGSTLLIIAGQNGNKKILKAILRRGGNINARNFKGNTALHYCYQFGYWDTLGKYLISKGADSQIRNNAGKVYTGGVS